MFTKFWFINDSIPVRQVLLLLHSGNYHNIIRNTWCILMLFLSVVFKRKNAKLIHWPKSVSPFFSRKLKCWTCVTAFAVKARKSVHVKLNSLNFFTHFIELPPAGKGLELYRSNKRICDAFSL